MTQKETLILIVDDHPANLEVLFEMFDTTDFEVAFVTDGQRCLDIARSDHPSLILLDVMMPDMDGFEVCQHLKADDRTQDIPVIFMTALAETENKVKGFDMGAVDYITKPFQAGEVLARGHTHVMLQTLKNALRDQNAALQQSLERESQLNAELQAALEREKEFNQLKSRFISIASHELRSPLSLIGMTGNMLKRYHDRMPETKRAKHLDMIEHSVKEMTELLDDVLVISKIESGQFAFCPKTIDSEGFCQDIVERFAMMSEETHRVTFCGTGEPFQARVDVKLLAYFFKSPVKCPEIFSGGRDITFTLERGDASVAFSISDQGIGMTNADVSMLFEAFRRGENVKHIPGTGLGLWIVKEFVELHGGSIHVDVERQGEHGTTFRITLPLI